jgi:hypothetical protein
LVHITIRVAEGFRAEYLYILTGGIVMSHGYSGTHMSKTEIAELENSLDSQDCLDFVENHLIDMLDNDVAIGVCKFWASNGYSSLSEKQKNVAMISLQQNLLKCGRCDEFVWEEAAFIIDNGLCTYCQQVWDND